MSTSISPQWRAHPTHDPAAAAWPYASDQVLQPIEKNVFPDLKRRHHSPEHPERMDLPDVPQHELEQDLLNLEKINRYFGGRCATRFILEKIRQNGWQSGKILDCACGAGDLTSMLASSLPGSRITAVDLHPKTLAYAEKKHGKDPGNILWQQADIKKLPFPDLSFDLVVCQLALHHFSDTEAVHILGELQRVSNGPVIVTDLARSTAGYAGIWLLVHTWLRHPMTRHDALLSLRRAFIEKELIGLARQAAWPRIHTARLGWFRQALWSEPVLNNVDPP